MRGFSVMISFGRSAGFKTTFSWDFTRIVIGWVSIILIAIDMDMYFLATMDFVDPKELAEHVAKYSVRSDDE